MVLLLFSESDDILPFIIRQPASSMVEAAIDRLFNIYLNAVIVFHF
jgi:hypothetical protein